MANDSSLQCPKCYSSGVENTSSSSSASFMWGRYFWPVASERLSSPNNPFSVKSFLMLFIHLRFGLPFRFFPGTSITITLLPTYFSFLATYFREVVNMKQFDHLHFEQESTTVHIYIKLRKSRHWLHCPSLSNSLVRLRHPMRPLVMQPIR